jgi:signal transduction histidine kinase
MLKNVTRCQKQYNIKLHRGFLNFINNPSKGSGLGLAIAAKIVEHFGGSIRAANAPHGGLSIIMTFPRHDV